MWNVIRNILKQVDPIKPQAYKSTSELPSFKAPHPLDLDTADRVLVVAPHPDDESIGCAGTIRLLVDKGKQVQVVLLTDGGGAGGLTSDAAKIRQNEFIEALDILGVKSSSMLNQEDGNLQINGAWSARVCALINDFKPQWVFLPSLFDHHRDHLIASHKLRPICLAAASVDYIIYYETWAPVPASHVVDITAVWPQKLHALEKHRTAMSCADYIRAVDGLNSFRGIHFGRNKRAEAFLLESRTMRSVIDDLSQNSFSLFSYIANNINQRSK